MEQTTSLPLNQGQQLAAAGFFAFLMNDTQKELNISGPGGYGKTFLMGHMIDVILPQYFDACQLLGIEPQYNEVVMTATTNKAADVLGKSTGRPASTVHSFMNLTVKDDYSTGKSKVEKTREWQVYQNKILFVDEASMVDNGLLTHVREGTIKCKIVYVGDHCQLAPVGEAISPVYAQKIPFFELTEPMRNAGQPALQALCAQARQTVEDGIFRDIQIVPGVIDHLTGDQFEAEIRQNFIDPEFNGRILTYTNQRAIDYNQFIREVRGLPEQFQIGEHLINNSAIRLGRDMLRVEEEIQILDLTPSPEMFLIDDAENVELEVRYATVENSFGARIHGVKIPTDRDHYNALLKYFKSKKNWNRFYFLKNNFPDLRQRDACTTYKAQGSTYHTAYIDLNDIGKCHNPAQASRLLYVADTRPTSRIAFYGELPAKYGKLIQ